MNARDIARKGHPDLKGSMGSARVSPLLGRKSVLMGMLTSGFVIANAAQSSASAAGTVKPSSIAATQPSTAMKWGPSTAYALGMQVISPNNDVVSAKSAHTSSAAYSTDTAKWSLSPTFAPLTSPNLTGTPTVNGVPIGTGGGATNASLHLPINIMDPAYGAKVDGSTDDSAAWVLAIAIANVNGSSIYLPAGTSVINRTTFLPDLTALGASITGDPSGESSMSFTAAGGGISIGNGSSYVYATKLTDLKVLGNGVCQTPIRMRMSEEACFRNIWVVGAAVACIDVVSATNLFTSQRMTLSNSPVGMRFGGSTGYVSFFQSNFYLVQQCFQNISGEIYRMVFGDGWIEACADFFTVATGVGGWATNQVIIRDTYFLSTLAATRMFRVISSSSSVNIASFRVVDCNFNYTASTTPLIDTTAVALISDVHFSLHDIIIAAPSFGAQVFVKPHASQQWWSFYVDAQRIQGIPTNQWSAQPAVTGGVRSAPSDLQGTGTPENQFSAFPGSTYRRLDGGAGTAFYVKETGTGATGWIAK